MTTPQTTPLPPHAVAPARRLRQFVIKPTVFCYHRCPYCDLRQDYYTDMVADRRAELRRSLPLATSAASARSAPARIPNPGHMPRDMALRLIDEAADLGMEELQLSGGDPLLYPHLLDVIHAAKSHRGVFVLMNSVGTGITHERATDIIGAGLGAWNFSIDTLDPDLYEKLRGVKNALPTILEAVDTVRAAGAAFLGFRINLMAVITRQNFRGLPEVFAHAVRTGFASIYLMNVYGDTTGESLLGAAEIAEFRDATVPSILGVLADLGTAEVVQHNAAAVLGSFFGRDNPDTNYAKGVYWPTMRAAHDACRLPDYYALIEPDGRTLPCCMVEIAHTGEIGNVLDESLASVFDGDTRHAFRDNRIDFCLKCPSPRNRTVGLIPSMCRQFRD